MEKHGSMPPNLQAGTRALVNVEGVFNGGMIVAFNTSEGSEFRGALLQTSSCSTCGQPQPVLTKSVSSLANPMTYLHDHPYSDLQKYAREISAKMPPRLFLQWNNIPELDAIPSPSSPHKLHSRTHNGKVEHSSSATVVTCVNSPPGDYTWPYILKNPEQRTAKCVARMKLQEGQDLDHAASPKRGKEIGKVRNKKRGIRARVNSPMSGGKKKRSHVKDDNDLQWFESINHDRGGRKVRSLSPRCKVALKELSIPLMKIPVGVKRKLREYDRSATSSVGSSRCSTVDSLLEQSSRLSSSPLSDGLAYVNVLD